MGTRGCNSGRRPARCQLHRASQPLTSRTRMRRRRRFHGAMPAASGRVERHAPGTTEPVDGMGPCSQRRCAQSTQLEILLLGRADRRRRGVGLHAGIPGHWRPSATMSCLVWSMRRFTRARAALTRGTHAHGLIRPEANTGPGAIQNSLDATAATAAAFAPQTGPYGTATPTASTLNPEYDLLWQIPLQANRGKQMLFKIVYEADWNNCVREDCAGMR